MDAQTAESLLSFAEEAAHRYRGREARTVLGQLEAKYGDLLAAMQWFIDQGRTGQALRLASSLALFWTGTARLDEGSAWFDRVLKAPGGEGALKGQALFDAGLLAFWTGNDERASELHNRALETGRQIHDPTVTALALSGLARIALRTSGVEEARRLCREALAVTEGTADRSGRSNAIHVLGVAAQMAGDFLEARELMNARIALGRELGNLATVGYESGNLSMVERQLGNLERAGALAREALEIYSQRGDEWAIPLGVSGIAAVATDRGEFERAATLAGAAEAMMEAAGADWPPDERVQYERMLAALTGAMGSAAFVRARAAGRSMKAPEAVAFALGTRPSG